MYGLWKAPATGSRTARRTPRSRAFPTTQSMSSSLPASTTCDGSFTLATHSRPPSERRAAAISSARSSPAPSSAAIPAGSVAAALAIAAPRAATSRSPV